MRKIFFLSLIALFASAYSWAQSVVITEAQGWLESAWVKWTPVAEADSYNVYYTGEGIADCKIDGMLIRKYADYFRADAVGLKAGNYTLRVVPVTGETELAAQAAVTGTLEVRGYVREGFAFSEQSPFKTGSGAYNNDGTLRSSAKVLYMTSATANTMQLDVVVDGKGKTETRTGIVNILAGRQKGYDKTPLAVRVIGDVRGSDVSGLNGSGYIQIKGSAAYSELNITFEGIGDDATANGWAFLVRSAGNVEIRNLGIMNFADDGVSLDTDNVNVWVHNNDFFYGKQGSGDKAKGDGSLDVKMDSRYVSLSYNHFWDSGKCSLGGMDKETGPNYITYHHNWFDHSDSRHPRVRTMTVHVYNNYFDGNAKYGVGATMGSSVFVENNYFRNCKYPMLISRQGTDVFYDSKGTFSNEDGGMIKAYGNTIIGAGRFVDQHATATEFDAVVTSTRDEKVGSQYKTLVGGTTYNNFDTDPSIMYAYQAETAEQAKESVMQYAGRVNGGDLKWTFNNAVDDPSYDINSGLRKAVTDYKGTVLAIGFGGAGDPGDPTDPIDPIDPIDPPVEGDMTHNFTTQDKESSFFTITGTLSTSKGSVSYGGLTLTQCLKMESGTEITFTTTEEATLTLVFNSDFSKNVIIDGEKHAVSGGILTLTIAAGSHSIKKGDTTNLFYMSVAYAQEPTGITPPAGDVRFTLYPNPVAHSLHVVSGEAIHAVELYNSLGVIVRRVEGNVTSVDVSDLPAGSYFVRLHTAQGVAASVVIKK